MRKTYKFSLIIALMLALSLLFTACSSPFDPDTDADDGAAKTNEEYKALLSEWAKYIEYKAPEQEKKPTATEIAATAENQTVTYGSGNYVVTTVTEEYKTIAEVETRTAVTTVTKVYSAETGREILSFTSVDVTLGGSGVVADGGHQITEHTVYTLSNFAAKVYQVKKEYYALVEAEPVPDGETAPEPQYEKKTVYSYYKTTGELLAENLEDTADIKRADNYASTGNMVITIADKAYVVNFEGDFLAEFAAGLEHNIPVFDPDSMTPNRRPGSVTTMIPGDSYAFFEYGDYLYVVSEELPRSVPVGDFTLFTVPGAEITIMDKNYKITANYKTDSYAVMSYAVLPDGSVYICEYKSLSKDAAEFDVQVQEEKFDIVNTVINAKTGATVSYDKNFVATKLYNEATKEIKSFLNQATVGVLDGTADFFANGRVKDGYILAEIQEFENGVLSADSEFAVLNASLEVVAKLPKILPDQFGYASFEASGNMLVATRAANDKLVFYSADVSTGEISLFTKNIGDITFIDNGFIYKGVVYDENWEERYEFGENSQLVKVANGKFYYLSYNTLYVGSIRNDSYDPSNSWYYYQSDSFIYEDSWYGDRTFNVGDGFVVRTYGADEGLVRTYYDLDGNVILNTQQTQKDISTEHYDVTYSITETPGTLTELADGVYLCRVTCRWTSVNVVTKDESGILPETTKTETVYYIIK